jgi:DNA-binding HxlR family transcriptional regulator
MLKRTYANQICSVAWALELVGERWTLLIVRDALLGVTHFSEFRGRLGIVASVLANRLNHLINEGILERVPYHSRPIRYEYRLTPKGRDLALVIVSLMRWGDQHLAGDAGPPVTVRHLACGAPAEPVFQCLACAATLSPEEIHAVRTPDRRATTPQPAG